MYLDRNETKPIQVKGFLEAYLFLMHYCGRHTLVTACVIVVISTKRPLDPNYLFMVWPLLSLVNQGMVFRTANMMKSLSELEKVLGRLEVTCALGFHSPAVFDSVRPCLFCLLLLHFSPLVLFSNLSRSFFCTVSQVCCSKVIPFKLDS